MITERSLTILQELINIGVGKGAQVLNTLLSHHVALEVPVVVETTVDELFEALGLDRTQSLACVQMGYHGPLQGEVQLIFPSETAARMVSLIIGDGFAPEEFDFIRQATLAEVGNIVINAVIGTLSNLFGLHLQYSLPIYLGGDLGTLQDQAGLVSMQAVLLAKTRFTIQDLSLEGNMVLFFSMPTYHNLEKALEAYVVG